MFKAFDAMVYDDMQLINKYNKLGTICNTLGTIFAFGLFSYPYPTFDAIDDVQIVTGDFVDDSVHEFLISTLSSMSDEQFDMVVNEARRKRKSINVERETHV